MKSAIQFATKTLLLLLLPVIVFSQKSEHIVHFNSGKIFPVDNISTLTREAEVFTKTLFQEKYYVAIQFQQIPDEFKKLRLKSAGIELLDYLSGYAFTAAVNKNVDISLLKTFSIRSIFQLQTEQKLSNEIAQKKFPSHAILEAGFLDVAMVSYQKFDKDSLNFDLASLNINILEEQLMFRTYILRVPIENINKLAALPFVQWIEPIDPPNTIENQPGRSLHRVNILGDGPRNLQGLGVKIGVWDGGPTDISHPDFGPVGRVTLVENNPPITDHGTHVTGTVGGAGILDPFARGMAPKARIYSYDFTTGTSTTEINNALNLYGINISSHSYGASTITCGATSHLEYSATARNTDLNINSFPYHLHIHSSGNSQTVCPDGYRTITGSGKPAKNNIVVANITTLDALSGSSSVGPVLDGRLKPEISGMGTSVWSTMPGNTYASMSGTSMSTPGISGTLALLVERYKQLNGNANPNSSLIKAITFNTARDLGNVGPDYKFGYGAINALNAVKAIEDVRFVENTIANGETKTINVTVPVGATAIKVLVAWNDPAATAGAAIALINNLNLSVTDGTTTTLPWILDKDNPANPATKGIDNLNNHEQVTIDNPPSGVYTIIVNGTTIPFGPQLYSLTWEIESAGIEVTYPSGGESFDPGSSETITWNSTGVTGMQTVQYSIDNGINWVDLSTTVPATTTRFVWAIPSIISTNQALVRVLSGPLSGTSGNFNIVGTPKNVAFSGSGCTSGQLTVTWTAVTGATHYDVLRLDNFQGNYSVVGSNVTTNSFLSTGLTPGQTYTYAIIAKNNTLGWSSRRTVGVSTIAPVTSLANIGGITGPAAICSNTNNIAYSVASVSGATSYTWSAPSGVTIISGQGTNSILVNYSGQSESGNIAVFAKNNECQTSTSLFAVTVSAFTLSPVNPTICATTPVLLTANVSGNPATSFAWSPATGLSSTTGASVSANPIVTTTYTVTATNGTGCTTSQSTTVYIGDGPNAASSNSPICDGGDLQLFSSPATGVEKYASIKITEVSQFRNGIGGTPVFPPYVVLPNANEDLVEISNTDNANAVDVSGMVFEVWMNTALLRTFTVPNGVIIPPNQIMLLHIGDNGGPNNAQFRYFNTGGTNNPLASANPVGFLIKSGSTMIDVVATNSYAWPVASGVTVLDWSGDMASTSGLAGAIRTQATDNNTAANWAVSSAALLQSMGTYNAGYTNVSPYSWTGQLGFVSSAQNPVRPAVTIPMAGTYTVNITGGNGCSATTLNTVVSINTTTIPVITASSNNPLCFGTTLNLSVTTVGGATYLWKGPNDFSSSLQNPTIASINISNVGVYTVTVSLAGCSRTTTTTVNTIELNGTYTVGPEGNFTNLTAAVTAYNNATCLSGAVIFELLPTYTSGTESYPINILNHVSASAVNTLTIRPAADATPVVLGSFVGDALIRFNGARFVTIDGRAAGLGTDKSLTIDNTAVSPTAAGSGTIAFINGAQNNRITFSNILSAVGNATTAGNIMFRSTNNSNGNSNNTISNNYLSSSSVGTQSNYGIICDGTPATPNANNIIEGNELRHFVRRPITLNAGLGNNWTISNNHLYFPGGGTFAIMRMIHMSNTASSGHTISGNFIGGTGLGALGTLSLTSGTSNNWWGIELTLGNANTTTVSNNVVRGITMTTPAPTTTYNVIGIAALAGKYNITGNTVSGLTSNVSGAASTQIAGMLYQNSVATTGSIITENTIFDITNNNATATATAVYGLMTILTANETVDITRNKIYNIRMPNTTSTASTIYGMFIQGAVSASGSVNANNNMIALGHTVTNNVPVYGIFNSATSQPVNAIFNSVAIAGTVTTGANNSGAFFRSGTANATAVNIKNNIFNNSRAGGTGKHYAILNNHTTATTGWNATASNNNNLNSANTATLGLWGATDRTFAVWQTSSDALSKNILPVFQNQATADLRINTISPNCQLENSGAASTGITIDYFNSVRNPTPTIGAHELASAVSVPPAPVSGGNQTVCETIPIATLTATATVPAGINLVWYDAPTVGNIVPSPTLNTVNTITYYAEAVNPSCAGNISSLTRTAVTLIINGSPAAPTNPGNQTVCATNPVQSLTATATVPTAHTIVWYEEPVGGNSIANPTFNSVGTKYYYAASRNNSSGCESATRLSVSLTINTTPAPPLSNGDLVVCANVPIPALSVSAGLGVTVQWYSAPSGGLFLGNGNSYTPTASGTFHAQTTYTNSSCASIIRTAVTLTINPVPVGSASPQTICSGGTTNITLSANTPGAGTTYSYTAAIQTAPTVGTITGHAAGTANPISHTLTNTGTTFGVIRYTVTPTYTNAGVSCTGTPFTVDVTVNPIPTGSALPQTICSGTATSVALTANTPAAGTTFSYTAAIQTTPTGGTITGHGSGTANPIAQTLTNTGTTFGVIRYTVTPTYTNAGVSCSGTLFTVDVTVNPRPTSSALPQTICSGSTTSVTLINNTPAAGTSYAYTAAIQTAPTGGTISGFTAGTANPIAQALTNTGTTAAVIRYTATSTYTNAGVSCSSTPFTVDVTVNPIPVGTATPNSQAICSGATTSIALSTSAPSAGTTYSYSVAILTAPAGGSITGQAAGTANPIAQTLTNTGTNSGVVRYTITPFYTNAGVTCTGATFTVDVTVNKIPTIVCPANITIPSVVGTCAAVATYSTTVTGGPAPTQSYVFTGITTGSGSGNGSGSSFNVGVTTVTVTATNLCGSPSCTFTVTVTKSELPTINTQPANRTVCVGSNTSFSVAAVTVPIASGPLSYQWQAYNGTAWANITGATTPTLTLNGVTQSMNTNSYRVVITGRCTIVTSTHATLYVNPLPIINLTTSIPPNLLPTQVLTINATTSPAGGTYVWYKNNVILPVALGSTLGGLSVNDIGTYRVVYTDINGCIATSTNVDITSQSSEKLFVYPVPNQGVFNVRFYNQANEQVTVRVFDAKGAEVYQRKAVTTLPYTIINVDMKNGKILTSGTYTVEVKGANGRLIGNRMIIIN